MTDGFALKSWVISLFNKASKKNNKYSTTEETVVGTWIDGKPIYIYRRCIKTTTIKPIDVSSIPIEYIVIHGLSIESNKNQLTSPYYASNRDYLCWYYDPNMKSIYTLVSGGYSGEGNTKFIIIEYTKTTDKATVTV